MSTSSSIPDGPLPPAGRLQRHRKLSNTPSHCSSQSKLTLRSLTQRVPISHGSHTIALSEIWAQGVPSDVSKAASPGLERLRSLQKRDLLAMSNERDALLNVDALSRTHEQELHANPGPPQAVDEPVDGDVAIPEHALSFALPNHSSSGTSPLPIPTILSTSSPPQPRPLSLAPSIDSTSLVDVDSSPPIATTRYTYSRIYHWDTLSRVLRPRISMSPLAFNSNNVLSSGNDETHIAKSAPESDEVLTPTTDNNAAATIQEASNSSSSDTTVPKSEVHTVNGRNESVESHLDPTLSRGDPLVPSIDIQRVAIQTADQSLPSSSWFGLFTRSPIQSVSHRSQNAIQHSSTTEACEPISTEPSQTFSAPSDFRGFDHNGLSASPPGWFSGWMWRSTFGEEKKPTGPLEGVHPDNSPSDLQLSTSIPAGSESPLRPTISQQCNMAADAHPTETNKIMPSGENVNPILSSPEAKKSWMYFFSSSGTTTPQLRAQIEGVEGSEIPRVVRADEEIMQVDFGESEGPLKVNSDSGVIKASNLDAVDAAARASWMSLFIPRSATGTPLGSKYMNEPKENSATLSDDTTEANRCIDKPDSSSSSVKSKSHLIEDDLKPTTDIVMTESPIDSLERHSTKSIDIKESLKSISPNKGRFISPASSSSKVPESPGRTPLSNLILPTFEDTFNNPPRSLLPQVHITQKSSIRRGLDTVGGYLLGIDVEAARVAATSQKKAKIFGYGRHRPLHLHDDDRLLEWDDSALPRLWSVLENGIGATQSSQGRWSTWTTPKSKPNAKHVNGPDMLRGCKRAVIIGIHGWFPGTIARSVLGAPTGTSTKFANMMLMALNEFLKDNGDRVLEKTTIIPLEGEGKIKDRVEKLYQCLVSNKEWMADLHQADVVLIATHSQGSIVSTELLARLLREQHLNTSEVPFDVRGDIAATNPVDFAPNFNTKFQRVCVLAMCGIHLGPLSYLSSNSLTGPYLQIFESGAAKELFEFQNTENEASKTYVESLSEALAQNVKFVYVASLNDQVVPIYSGVFAAAYHPSILRALYIDRDAYSSSDFLSNVLVLLLRLRNAGRGDNGLLAHLSEATAGTLSGIGHSTTYEEMGTYRLAVRFLFEASGTLGPQLPLRVEPFSAKEARNEYEIPWALREIISLTDADDPFAEEWRNLSEAFDLWQPRTSILREMKRKLQPIQRLKKSRL